jgi:hypothetical protein
MSALIRSSHGWPVAYLQPDRNDGCMLYASAYIAHVFRFEASPENFSEFRTRTSKLEFMYLKDALGLPLQTFWKHLDDETERRRWWLGPGTQSWVQDHVRNDEIALVQVHRIPTIGHAVVLLEADDDSVLLMDPLTGFVRESWDWFLSIGPGPGHVNCHFIEAWIPLPETAR